MRISSKMGILLMVAAMGILPVSQATQAAETDEDLPALQAEAAVVVEATTGRVVYGKKEEERRYPASMTKMMTCILALEQSGQKKLVTVSPAAAATEDSTLVLQPADQVEMGEILTGMMLVSDNAAAVAIGENLAGSQKLFAQQMNEKAEEIGCQDTHFVNPNGLPNPNHYSTALDMAKIAAYCMKNPDFRDIVSQQKAVMHWASPKGKFIVMENTNELLGQYDGITGIKTGWTQAAGGCLAAAAKRNGVELIAIVMRSPDTDTRFDDAKKLLDYGFDHVRVQRVAAKERMQRSVLVQDGTEYKVFAMPEVDVNLPLLHGEKSEAYTLKYDLPRIVKAPVKRGQVLGHVVEQYRGKEVARIPLRASADVSAGFSFLSKFFVGLLAAFM